MKSFFKRVQSLIWNFRLPTPKENKRIGRFLTALAFACASLEAYFITNGVDVPKLVHGFVIISGAASIFWAAFHGQKVDNDKLR